MPDHPRRRPSSLEEATKLVTPDIRSGWVLGLYPDAGEASGTFHYRRQPRPCATPGPALDPERAASEAARRARTKVRRYAAANRLDRLGTLTYRGDGLHDERAVRRHIAHYFKRLRYEVIGEPFPYLWVPEWHNTDHGLHVHFAIDRYVKQRQLADVWGRGFVHIKRLGSARSAGTLESARHAAGYLSKYVAKSFDESPRCARLHRYEIAQGFAPKVERVWAPTRELAIDAVSEIMGRDPRTVWTSDQTVGWKAPPAVWMSWDD